MGRYARWKASLEARQDERIMNRAQADQAAEAVRAQQRAIDVGRLRRVPPGLVLHLLPDDWLDAPDLRTRDHVDVKVSTLVEPIMYQADAGWVRVWGHTPTCARDLPDDHGPCITVMVRLSVILDAALIS